ncbi:EAL domain-containing protein (putative c-di-GMP-specific phosphodiesterase class I) [Aureimonas pseudogalii]|uniref:EAL domain-containing protein (Putative c-di-GMP-specific phosphodiesterase class I) n=1 Tax=Aureimonas pseudogalii TaxID=1744844 RepID=A0A7W6H7Z6_9HYPH|nr:EAL domain-containing protein (putative c-di-GMP-specific phosphodiesterase class I) [Aureimonas pseudogalii]
MVEAVVALCGGYGLAMTGEGVETEQQRKVRLDLGCHDLQG